MIIHTVIKSLNLLGPNSIVAPTPCKPAREEKLSSSKATISSSNHVQEHGQNLKFFDRGLYTHDSNRSSTFNVFLLNLVSPDSYPPCNQNKEFNKTFVCRDVNVELCKKVLIHEILVNGVHDLVYGDSRSRSLEHEFWKLSKWWKITLEQGNKMWLDDPILNSMSEGTSESNKVILHTAPGHQKKIWKSSFTTSLSL